MHTIIDCGVESSLYRISPCAVFHNGPGVILVNNNHLIAINKFNRSVNYIDRIYFRQPAAAGLGKRFFSNIPASSAIAISIIPAGPILPASGLNALPILPSLISMGTGITISIKTRSCSRSGSVNRPIDQAAADTNHYYS
ncbi:hypothetical protein [Pelolinea submarina]|uniref:hypothetical protein n=1 Tax=Pelolinea submarina TaxID=913107 RepID=UPI000F82B5DB|nr:hypothetical protein [Pelolinea submarina]